MPVRKRGAAPSGSEVPTTHESAVLPSSLAASRSAAVSTLVVLILLAACGGSRTTVEGLPGVTPEPARNVTFAVGPNAMPAPGEVELEEPAEFVYRDVLYYAAVTWPLTTPSGLSPCTVDGASASHGFGIRISDATGDAYPGPVKLTVEAIPRAAQAFIAVGEVCASAVTYHEWSGAQLSGTVSLGTEEPSDLEGAGAVGLKAVLEVPGTTPITIVPGEGSQSERDDDFADAEEIPPLFGDHWHVAYGIFICSEYLPDLSDDGTDRTGIHTHDDGLVHVHPFSSDATGTNATLGLFTKQIDIRLEDDALGLPNGRVFQNGDDCGGEPARVRVLVWDSTTDREPREVAEAITEVPFSRDGMAVAIVFAPPGRNVDLPPSVPELAHPSDVPR